MLGLGHAARGSTRAISFSFFSFQASELGKVLLILALSAFVVERSRRCASATRRCAVMIAALVPAMFVIAQPDLGSGMVYMVVALRAAVHRRDGLAPPRRARGARSSCRWRSCCVAAPAVGVNVLKPYQVARLTAFLHPSSNPQKEGYQQQESKIAIGAGPEDRPRRARQPDPQRLRAREPDRLRVRGGRRAVRVPRRRHRARRSTRC